MCVEAGFVVRRRTTDIPRRGREAGRRDPQAHQRRPRSKLGALDADAFGERRDGRHRRPLRTTRDGASVESPPTSARQHAGAARSRTARGCAEWATHFDVAPQLQGWFADPSLEKIGAWADVDEKPRCARGMKPCSRCIRSFPPKNDTNHAGQFGTIYFGLLADRHRRDRFAGPRALRRSAVLRGDLLRRAPSRSARSRQPVPAAPTRCSGACRPRPIGSRRTSTSTGTSKQPVTVQLPDLDELAAQATPALRRRVREADEVADGHRRQAAAAIESIGPIDDASRSAASRSRSSRSSRRSCSSCSCRS